MNVETERLFIRRMKASDASFILGLVNEPAFYENIGDKGIRTEAEAQVYIQTAATDMYEQYGFGMFLVLLKEENRPLGMCGLLQRDYLPNPDIGFAYKADCWNRGYGTEAASAVLKWAQNDLGLEVLSAFTSTLNAASIRLLQKAGFKSLGEQELDGKEGKHHVLIWDTSKKS